MNKRLRGKRVKRENEKERSMRKEKKNCNESILENEVFRWIFEMK